MALKSNPWLGLASYTESNHLYGRDAEIGALLDIVVTNPDVTVIYGKSGIGKTSILRAGIFPKVRTMGFFPVYMRLDHDEQNEEGYTRQVMNAVSKEAERCHLSRIDLTGGQVAPTSLWEFFHRYKYRTLAGDECLPIVFFDQFEELFTISGGNRLRVEQFLHELAALLNDIAPEDKRQDEAISAVNVSIDELSISLDDEPASVFSQVRLCRLAIGIREDQLYHLEKISGTIPCLKRNRYLLQGLSHSGAVDVVTMPAQGLVTTGVAQEIISQCKNGDVEFIDPAFLSLVMYKLYEKMVVGGDAVITSALVQASVGDIFSDYFRDSIQGISDRTINFLEDKLVSKAGFRLSVPLSDAQAEGMSDAELSQLKNSRLVTLFTRGNHSFIELTHDLLCTEVMKDKAEREKTRLAQQNRRRMLLLGCTVAIVLAIAGMFAYQFWQIQKSQQELKARNTELQNKNQEIEGQRLQLELQKQGLEEANRRIAQSSDSLQFMFNQLEASQNNLHRSNWDANENATRWIATKAIDRIKNGEALNLLSDLLARTPISVAHPDKPFSPELEYALRMANRYQTRTISGHTGTVRSVAFSPDGKSMLSTSEDGTCRLWNVKTGKEIRCLNKHVGSMRSATFSPDGRQIATLSTSGVATIWDVENGRELASWGESLWEYSFHLVAENPIVYSNDGKLIAAAYLDGTIKLWDVHRQKVKNTLKRHSGQVTTVSFSPDGKRLVSACEDGSILVWDVNSGDVLNKYQSNLTYANYALYSPDGKYIAHKETNNVVLHNTDNRNNTRNIAVRFVRSFAFSPDSKRIYASGKVHDIKTAKSSQSYFSGMQEHVVVSRNEEYVASFGTYGDCTIHLTTLRPLNQERVVLEEKGCINAIAASPNGRYIAFSTSDGVCAVWDVKKEKTIRSMKNLGGGKEIAFSGDSKYIIHRFGYERVGMWNIETGKLYCMYRGNQFALSPDGEHIVTTIYEEFGKVLLEGSEDSVSYCVPRPVVWNVKNGDSIMSLPMTTEEWIRPIILFSPDGKRVVINEYATAKIYDARNGQYLSSIMDGGQDTRCMAFSPDGKYIASGSKNKSIKIWDVEHGTVVDSIDVGRSVEQIAYSPDGRYIVAAEAIYETGSGQKVMEISGDYATFTPDGKYVLSSSYSSSSSSSSLLMWRFDDIQDIIDNLRKHYQ